MIKKKTIDKRFVDYVFLAGLPTDFQINPKKQKEKVNEQSNIGVDLIKNDATDFTEEEIQARENDTTNKENEISSNVTSKTSTIRSTESGGSYATVKSIHDNNDGNTSEVFNVSRKLLDRLSADLVTNDEESKQLFDSVFDNIVTNMMKFDQELDEFLRSVPRFPSISTMRSFNESSNNNYDGNDGSERRSKLFKDSDELLETNSVSSLLSNDTSKVQEESGDNRHSYQNVVPQQPS